MERIIYNNDFDFKELNLKHEFKLSDTTIDIMNIILAALRKTYPDEFEIIPHMSFKHGKFFIIIHFPTINITNMRYEKHIIHDIFVKLTVYEESSVKRLQLCNISGMRTSYTKEEVIGGYSHSHLSGGIRNSFGPWREFGERESRYYTLSEIESKLKFQHYEDLFSDFCLGNGGINKIISVINSNNKTQQDINNWILFFRSIKAYLEYESIEGGPYRRMADVGKKNTSVSSDVSSDSTIYSNVYMENIMCNYSTSIIEILNELVRDKKIELFLNENNKIEFKYNSNLETLFYDKLKQYFNHDFYMLRQGIEPNFCYVYVRNNVRYSFPQSKIDHLEKYYFPFRDKSFHCNLLNKNVVFDEKKTVEEVFHPSTIKLILKYYTNVCNIKKNSITNSKQLCSSIASDF